MGSLEEFEKYEKSVQEQLSKMKNLYQGVLEENKKLKAQLGSTGASASDFAIEVDDGSRASSQSRSKMNSSLNIPSAVTSASNASDKSVKPSSKVAEMDLDELIQTDPLARSVYNKLVPLGTIKQRVLAMQMGISQEKCKIAIERLNAAGGVELGDNDQVTAIQNN